MIKNDRGKPMKKVLLGLLILILIVAGWVLKLVSELHFWKGEIFKVKAARIAVLGIDCAVGKRTTAHL
jgi:hypothetical protein